MHNIISNLEHIKKKLVNHQKAKIIAVSKTFAAENIAPLLDNGHRDFGENKVQEALQKWPSLKEKYKNINWQIFMRKDVITQCLSFIYTNKTQIIRDNQTQIVDVDINLIDYFVDNFKIVNDIKSKNIYPVYYYEDQSMLNTVFKKNNNNYKKLIKNIDDVMEKINYLLP